MQFSRLTVSTLLASLVSAQDIIQIIPSQDMTAGPPQDMNALQPQDTQALPPQNMQGLAPQDMGPQIAPPFPLVHEINISNMYARNINGSLTGATFTIQPDDINCAGFGTDFTSNETISCDNNDGWSFALFEINDSVTQYELSVYKATSQFAGIYDIVNITLACHSGGITIYDFICYQPSFAPILMTLNPSGPYAQPEYLPVS